MQPNIRLSALNFRTIVALFLASASMVSARAEDRPRPAMPLQWAPTRTYHVENYKLTLHFSQSQGEVFGEELLTLRPFEPGFTEFCLNSTELEIDSVKWLKAHGESSDLIHRTDDHCLWITLGQRQDSPQSLNISIVYHGHPRTGLFFVNPDRSDPRGPPEIYTQGEPELNHYWFPCWDYPNDMATSETITTVPEGQVVVSNGTLVNVTHAAGQVTYDWVESTPHSSYLTSLAVGPWKKLTDSYEGKPVDYYVASGVAAETAKRSFHLTPDMIGFFSRATGVEYPYEKYAQIAVRNFIFGGQEDVSATILSDGTLHDARADIDYPSTILVAHELGQHWFGDYVQGRDWANIWLNEGFATYMTALYTQYHENNDAYRYEIYDDQNTALAVEASGNRRPIVNRKYSDPMDMLEEITHEKGASVLDMMRYVADGTAAMQAPASQAEPLFQALNHYLTSHQGSAADTADLLSSIWTRTGQDLTWFFHEWVFKGGHPGYRITARYDRDRKMAVVRVLQTQTTDDNTPVFDMPIPLAFFGETGETVETVIRDNAVEQEFEIPLVFAPAWVDFDPDDIIYKTVEFDKTTGELIQEAQRDPHMMSRLWATQQLAARSEVDAHCCIQALTGILNGDAFYGVRIAAAGSLGAGKSDEARQALLSAMQQPDSRVRAAVITALANYASEPPIVGVLSKALRGDPSYAAEAAAAVQLGHSGFAGAFNLLRAKLDSSKEVHVTLAVLDGVVATKNPQAADTMLLYAQPDKPARIRMHALENLSTFKDELDPSHARHLADTVKAALDDPYLPLHDAAVHLVDVFRLKQFAPLIERDSHSAVMIDDREEAARVLAHLKQ